MTLSSFISAARGLGLTKTQLAKRLLTLRIQEGYDPEEALINGILDPGIPPEARAGRISKRHLIRLQRRHNPQNLWRHTEDKAVFHRLCAGRGLPTPRLLGVLLESDPEAAWWELISRQREEEFVIKPSFGAYGRGVRLFSPQRGGFRDPAGRRWTVAEILEDLKRDGDFHRFVVQPRVRNHPVLDDLTGSPYLQCLRVVTYVDPSGKADAYFALIKLIVGANSVDNLDGGRTGNIACPVDLEEGKLLPGHRILPERLTTIEVDRHPVTGARLPGVQLPWWKESIDLVLKAAVAFLPHRTIGWDVALAPAGPLLIEGNIYWDPVDFLVTGPTLAAKRNMAVLLRRLRSDRTDR